VELYLHSPDTYSWRGAYLSTGTSLTLPYHIMLTFSADTNIYDIMNGLKIFRSGIRGCIQKFPDWPPGARTANGIALCH
jgi:hypothetical protein